jgi:hypothetical protein
VLCGRVRRREICRPWKPCDVGYSAIDTTTAINYFMRCTEMFGFPEEWFNEWASDLLNYAVCVLAVHRPLGCNPCWLFQCVTPTPPTCDAITCLDSFTCALNPVECVLPPCPPPAPACVPQTQCTKTCGANQRCYTFNDKQYCADVCTTSRCAAPQTCSLVPDTACKTRPCPPVAKCSIAASALE